MDEIRKADVILEAYLCAGMLASGLLLIADGLGWWP